MERRRKYLAEGTADELYERLREVTLAQAGFIGQLQARALHCPVSAELLKSAVSWEWICRRLGPTDWEQLELPFEEGV